MVDTVLSDMMGYREYGFVAHYGSHLEKPRTGAVCINPPSTSIVLPVMNAELSDSKKVTAFTMSATVDPCSSDMLAMPSPKPLAPPVMSVLLVLIGI